MWYCWGVHAAKARHGRSDVTGLIAERTDYAVTAVSPAEVRSIATCRVNASLGNVRRNHFRLISGTY